MNLLIKFPTRSRPEKFLQVLSAYQRMRSTNNVHFLITMDIDDVTMNQPHIRNVLNQWGNLTYVYGKSDGKIHAVNRDMEIAITMEWDVVLLASDDMIPVVTGYDKIILNDMHRYYSDTDGVLWYNDGFTGNRLNTLCILGRKYFERFQYIYHPDYKSLWCDNEFMDVANKLGKQTYIDRVIIRHEHPMNNRAVKMDNQYRTSEAFYSVDKETYERRKAIGFELEKQMA